MNPTKGKKINVTILLPFRPSDAIHQYKITELYLLEIGEHIKRVRIRVLY